MKNKWTTKLNAYFCKLVASGMPMNEIAKEFNISVPTAKMRKSQLLGQGINIKPFKLDDNFWKQYQGIVEFNSPYNQGNLLRKKILSFKVFED